MIRVSDLEFHYPSAEGFHLHIPGLAVNPGERLAIVGPSGSGKSTLLALLSGIRIPDRGSIRIGGTDLARMDERKRRHFRIRNIGQVFQTFELMAYLSVVENVMLPYFIDPAGTGADKRQLGKRAMELLTDVGLGAKASVRPGELSQGEQQRVAVCRAMLNHPALLLADEPTGNLDQANKQNVVDLLLDQADRNDSTLLMVTHDQSLLESFSRVLDIRSIVGEAVGEASEGT
jgi:ABC-type lipoprotein export system ATPase subunit